MTEIKPSYKEIESRLKEEVAKRKLAEKAKFEIEHKYNNIFTYAADAIFIIDPSSGSFIDCNEKAAQRLGYTKEELLKLKVFDINVVEVHPDIPELFKKQLAGESILFETRHKHKDGHEIPSEISSRSFEINGQKILLSIARDITERKQAEEKIKGQNEFLNNVIESIPYPFYVVDVQSYEVLMANSITAPNGCWQGATCFSLTHHREKPCNGKEHLCPIEEVKRSRKPIVLEHIHYDSKGDKRNVAVHGYPIFNAKGHIIQMIEYSIDMTDRKILWEQREVLIADLAKALSKVKLLSGFLPICSSCKKIRNDEGYWTQIESYIRDHSEAEFSHGICPECYKKLYPEFDQNPSEK